MSMHGINQYELKLQNAVEADNVKELKEALENQEHIREIYTDAALTSAAKYGYEKIVRVLLRELTFHPCILDEALTAATSAHHPDVVKLLVASGKNSPREICTAFKRAQRASMSDIGKAILTLASDKIDDDTISSSNKEVEFIQKRKSEEIERRRANSFNNSNISPR
jgi:hypothetical protein